MQESPVASLRLMIALVSVPVYFLSRKSAQFLVGVRSFSSKTTFHPHIYNDLRQWHAEQMNADPHDSHAG